jgi:hypothetical protein
MNTSKVLSSIRALLRKLVQALVNAPFLVQLVLLPFLLVYEQIHKRLYPEEARRKQAVFQRNQAAAKVFQGHLDKVALYREGRTLTLCKIVHFEVDEHLVAFDAEPIAHSGLGGSAQPWRFSINWDYFFYDAKLCAADSQWLRWSVHFDDERIEKLCQYALTLEADLEPDERYKRLNHFFIYEKEAQARPPTQSERHAHTAG